jgi:hypothetical protein
MLARSGVAAWGAFGVLSCLAPGMPAAAGNAPTTTVAIERNGEVFEIEATSRVRAGVDVAWAVLTDYEGYVNFVPGMTHSLRLGERPLLIEQRGEFGVLFFRKQVYATLEVEQDEPAEIRFRALAGNMGRLDTRIRLRVDGDHVVLAYQSVIEPDFWVPPVIGTPIVRAAIHRKLDAVAGEIERRAGDMNAGQ